jgi:sulfate adenylyltransferase subunit 1 (EFTu-like GTPase family)
MAQMPFPLSAFLGENVVFESLTMLYFTGGRALKTFRRATIGF